MQLPKETSKSLTFFLQSCCFQSWFSPVAVRAPNLTTTFSRARLRPDFAQSSCGHAGAKRNLDMVEHQCDLLHGQRRLVGHLAVVRVNERDATGGGVPGVYPGLAPATACRESKTVTLALAPADGACAVSWRGSTPTPEAYGAPAQTDRFSFLKRTRPRTH